MKIWVFILCMLFAFSAEGKMRVGPSVDFLSVPHPLNFKLHLQTKPITTYLTLGSFRTLYENDEPVVMRNLGIGVQYSFSNLYVSLEAGTQRLHIHQGEGSLDSKYIIPGVGYSFNFDSGLFIQSEVGYQINLEARSSVSNVNEQDALNRFGRDSRLSFTLLRVGYFF